MSGRDVTICRSDIVRIRMSDGVPVYMLIHELPSGIVVNWEGITIYQLRTKGHTTDYTITVDKSGISNGRIIFNVTMFITVRNKKGKVIKTSSVVKSIPLYAHTMPIIALISAGYLNSLYQPEGLRPVDLYSMRVRRKEVRPNSMTESHPHISHDENEEQTSFNETDWSNDNDDDDGHYEFNHGGHDGTGETGMNVTNSSEIDGHTSNLQGAMEDANSSNDSDTNALTPPVSGEGKTSVFVSDAYEWYGEPFNSPFDQEIGVIDESGSFIRNSNEIDDPIVNDFINDRYMDQYQQDIDDNDSSDSTDDPYSDWSDSWDPWEV